jgi:peptide/nickel transport system substrate-binding protein
MTRPAVACAVVLASLAVAGAVGLAADTRPVPGREPRRGGILTLMQREELPNGFAIHETATIATVWPAAPCFSNLVVFDPLVPQESAATVRPELAERWSWQDGYRHLVFFLRKDVTWHDGHPFTSRDVTHTFDLVREAPGLDPAGRLRLNPRKIWYANVERIEAPDAHTVVFHLKQPQPSLLLMLAAGYSPVYPAHVAPAEMRTRCVGTGPFVLKEWRKGEFVEYARNPRYFVPGRPYLDGLRYLIVPERGTRTAALQTGRLDVAFPGEGRKTIVAQMTAAEPRLRVSVVSQNTNDNLLLNTRRAPFDDRRVRRALSLALDRRAFAQAVHQGGGVVGAAMTARPYGVWGLLDRDLAALPGYGRADEDRAHARRLLAEAGVGAAGLRIEIVTRALAIYLDVASFVAGELKKIGVETTLRQVESAQWFPMLTRHDFQIAVNLTGNGLDDPDAILPENYGCGSPRNYGDYCDERVTALLAAQSRELDAGRRRALVTRIQTLLEEDAPRPVLAWRLDHFVQWSHVRGLVPHHVEHNWARMQDVWLDR